MATRYSNVVLCCGKVETHSFIPFAPSRVPIPTCVVKFSGWILHVCVCERERSLCCACTDSLCHSSPTAITTLDLLLYWADMEPGKLGAWETGKLGNWEPGKLGGGCMAFRRRAFIFCACTNSLCHSSPAAITTLDLLLYWADRCWSLGDWEPGTLGL